jgi:protein-S-isoprenylcysteine O-methyltransferase Ste14
MLEGARLYLEGSAAAVVMVLLGVVSGIVALAFSDDHRVALLASAVAFLLAGIGLTARLWRMTRAPAAPIKPPA